MAIWNLLAAILLFLPIAYRWESAIVIVYFVIVWLVGGVIQRRYDVYVSVQVLAMLYAVAYIIHIQAYGHKMDYLMFGCYVVLAIIFSALEAVTIKESVDTKDDRKPDFASLIKDKEGE